MDLNNLPNHISVITYPEKNSHDVIYKCMYHGEIIQKKRYFDKAVNCPKCIGKSLSFDDKIKKMCLKHDFKYDYSLIHEITNKKLKIICPVHGVFEQLYSYHVAGSGCPMCAGKSISPDEYYDKYSKKYPNIDFSKTDFSKKSKDKITAVCKTHGEFTTTIERLKLSSGCQECRYEKTSSTRINVNNSIEIIKRCNNVHSNFYKYEFFEYMGVKEYINIICPIHGQFEQQLYSHLAGHGCEKCSKSYGKVEEEIANFVGGELRNRKIINPKEIDILCDTFGIEYNGLMWHSFGKSDYSKFDNVNLENKLKSAHLEKTKLMEERGFQLFHIFENEWLDENKLNIWKSILNSKLNRTRRIYARKCSIREVKSSDGAEFERNNHLQGKCNSSIRLGLYYENELVSLMTFGKSRYNKNVEYELIRFCSKLNTTIVGGASKLLKYFERKYKPKSIISYANRRWSQGNVYEKLGFENCGSTGINYFYFRPNDRILYSRVKFQKHKLKDQLDHFDANATETENMYNNGYRKIYDSGNLIFIKRYKETHEI